jgi:hypothetical protein
MLLNAFDGNVRRKRVDFFEKRHGHAVHDPVKRTNIWPLGKIIHKGEKPTSRQHGLTREIFKGAIGHAGLRSNAREPSLIGSKCAQCVHKVS